MMWIKSSNDEKWSFRYMLIMNLTVAGKSHICMLAARAYLADEDLDRISQLLEQHALWIQCRIEPTGTRTWTVLRSEWMDRPSLCPGR